MKRLKALLLFLSILYLEYSRSASLTKALEYSLEKARVRLRKKYFKPRLLLLRTRWLKYSTGSRFDKGARTVSSTWRVHCCNFWTLDMHSCLSDSHHRLQWRDQELAVVAILQAAPLWRRSDILWAVFWACSSLFRFFVWSWNLHQDSFESPLSSFLRSQNLYWDSFHFSLNSSQGWDPRQNLLCNRNPGQNSLSSPWWNKGMLFHHPLSLFPLHQVNFHQRLTWPASLQVLWAALRRQNSSRNYQIRKGRRSWSRHGGTTNGWGFII